MVSNFWEALSMMMRKDFRHARMPQSEGSNRSNPMLSWKFFSEDALQPIHRGEQRKRRGAGGDFANLRISLQAHGVSGKSEDQKLDINFPEIVQTSKRPGESIFTWLYQFSFSPQETKINSSWGKIPGGGATP